MNMPFSIRRTDKVTARDTIALWLSKLAHGTDLDRRIRGIHRARSIWNRYTTRFKCILLCLAVAACAQPRIPFEYNQQLKAQIPGFPNVRMFTDANDQGFWATGHSQAGTRDKFALLSLSGGGADGAFGAGILNGWSQCGDRPEFTVVTGVSTGALMAPFAFLGSYYDSVLRDIYTSGYGEQIVKSAHITNGLFGPGLVSASSFQGLISQFVDARLLTAIAREHRKGRRLIVVTTNLDAERAVLWDMGAIATSSRSDALSLFRKVLAASARFPGIFSPVLIDVEAGGARFQEMHVDGGTTEQISVVTETALRRSSSQISRAHSKSIYLLINTKVEPSFEVTANTPLSTSSRALWTLVKTQRRGRLLGVMEFARRNGYQFQLAYIDRNVSDKGSVEFDTSYMRSLFDHGLRSRTVRCRLARRFALGIAGRYEIAAGLVVAVAIFTSESKKL